MRTVSVAAVLLLVVLAFFFDVIFGSKVLLTANPALYPPWRAYAGAEALERKTYRTDSILTYLPRRAELSTSIASGRFPLWNPYILTGAPFFADPQSRVLYPISLALVPVRPEKAMGIDAAAHFFLAMLGMYLFLRSIAARTAGALAGALGYGFSSFFATRMGHPTFVATAAWVPFLFYGFELARRRERLGTLALAAFLALGYLAGFPQVLVFGVMGLALYALVLAADRHSRGGRAEAMAAVRIVAVSGAISLLVVAVHLVPFWEFLRNSVGLGIDFGEMRELYVSRPVLLLRTLVPGFFGNPVDGTNWVQLVQPGTHPYNSGFMVYCGVGIVVAALAGLAYLRTSGHMRALALILAASLGIGASGIVMKVAYAAVPLVRYAQIDRISVMACFALAAMGGKGLSCFAASASGRERRVFLGIATAVVALAALGVLLFALAGPGVMSRLAAKSLAPAGGGWPAMGSEKLGEWAGHGGSAWFAFEERQIVRSLVFALVSLGCILLWGLAPGRWRRAGAVAAWVFVASLGVDVVSFARTYYVSQPSPAVRQTEGIKLLRGMAGEAGEWRTLNEEAGTWVFPPNTNEIFGLEALRGRATIMPRSFAGFLSATEPGPVGGEAGAAARADRAAELARLVSARYLLKPEPDPGLMGTAVFEAFAKQAGAVQPFKMLDLGGDTRLAFCQAAGETASVTIYAPRVARLDFDFGLVGAGVAGDSLVFAASFENPSGRIEFRKAVGSRQGRDGWHRGTLDLSGLGQGRGTLRLAASPRRSRQAGVSSGGVVGWSGLELVLRDCAVRPTGRGYAVDTGGGGGVLGIELASDAREVPLEWSLGSERLVRHLSFPPHLKHRRSFIDLGDGPAGGVEVTSDSTFSLTECRVLYRPRREVLDYDLVYDGDMCIYEDAAAMEKAFCVASGGIDATGTGTSRVLNLGDRLARISGMRCGKTRIVSYRPERIVIQASPEEDAWLLVQDAFYPGWRARVDGKPATVVATDLGTRAVRVPMGNHAVVMEYRPRALTVGLGLTAVGLFLGILYAARASWTKRN